jgi:hypothetical protein
VDELKSDISGGSVLTDVIVESGFGISWDLGGEEQHNPGSLLISNSFLICTAESNILQFASSEGSDRCWDRT